MVSKVFKKWITQHKSPNITQQIMKKKNVDDE